MQAYMSIFVAFTPLCLFSLLGRRWRMKEGMDKDFQEDSSSYYQEHGNITLLKKGTHAKFFSMKNKAKWSLRVDCL